MTTYDVTVSREADNWLAQCVQEPTLRLSTPSSLQRICRRGLSLMSVFFRMMVCRSTSCGHSRSVTTGWLFAPPRRPCEARRRSQCMPCWLKGTVCATSPAPWRSLRGGSRSCPPNGSGSPRSRGLLGTTAQLAHGGVRILAGGEPAQAPVHGQQGTGDRVPEGRHRAGCGHRRAQVLQGER